MISVIEARKLIAGNIKRCRSKKVPLLQASGMVLAEDIYSSVEIPAFPQSSMDGYAFLFGDWKKKLPLAIEGESAAGSSPANLRKGQRSSHFYRSSPCHLVQIQW